MNGNIIINLITVPTSKTNSETLVSDDQPNFTEIMAIKNPEITEEKQSHNKASELNNVKKKELIDEKTFKSLDGIILSAMMLVQELDHFNKNGSNSTIKGNPESNTLESLEALIKQSFIHLSSVINSKNTLPNELFDTTTQALKQLNLILDKLNGFFSTMNLDDPNIINDKLLSKDFFDMRSVNILKKLLGQMDSTNDKQLSARKNTINQSGSLQKFEELTHAQSLTIDKVNKLTDFLIQVSNASLKSDQIGKFDQNKLKNAAMGRVSNTATTPANSLRTLYSNHINEAIFEGDSLLKQISEQILVGKEGGDPNSKFTFNDPLTLNVGLVETQTNSHNINSMSFAKPIHQSQLITLFGSTAWEDAFKQQILFFVKNDIHNAKLTLTPKNMGLINIQIVLDDHLVKLQLFAANPHVRQSMEGSIPSLKEAFNAQGFELEESSINHSDFSQDSNGAQSGLQQSNHPKQGSKDEKRVMIKTNTETTNETELSPVNNARSAGVDSFV